MKRSRLFTAICLAAAALLTACTQDELSSPSEGMEGAYPLQIGSVILSVESSEQPWTRVSESEDGGGSAWTPSDEFSVKFDDYDDIGTYRIKDDGTVEAVKPLYWKSTTQTSNITAWYTTPSATETDGTVNLSDQSAGLVYVLQATASSISYKSTVNLEFEHQLAKLRVVTKGTYDLTNATISVSAPASCAVNQGSVTAGTSGTITMHKATYEDIGTCWEANVVPGTVKTFTINSTNTVDLTADLTMTAAQISTATLTVTQNGTKVIDLDNQGGTITIDNDNQPYYITGSGTNPIVVNCSGNPQIWLDNVSINTSDASAISINGGCTATLHIEGNCTASNTSNAHQIGVAGIYVASGSTINIIGNKQVDRLETATRYGGSGIGGYEDSNGDGVACGNIVISNVTVEARGKNGNGRNPGIGGAGNAACEGITIKNATVHAYGYGSSNAGSPAIGAGMSGNNELGSVPSITINNSEIYAYRGGGSSSSYADWIGSSGSSSTTQQSGYADGIKITNTVVYQYRYGTNTYAEGSSSFDENGVRTENP